MNHTAQTVIAEIEENAKSFAAPTPELRMVRTIEVGEHVRQGDCLIERLTRVPKVFSVRTTNRQLAPGTTQGSRHVLGVAKTDWLGEWSQPDQLPHEHEVWILPKAEQEKQPLVGPVIVITGRCVVTHPEHAHVSLPSGTYGVTYERDLEREEIARVVD